MKQVTDLLIQILQTLKRTTPFLNTHFSVKVNEKGQVIGYLRPETGAVYCSMSISHFKSLLSSKKIPSIKFSEKITLVRISDIDKYIEMKGKENHASK